MPTVLGLCGLGDSIPAEVQGRNFAPLFFDEKAEIVRPTGALYIQNVDGDKDENGSFTSSNKRLFFNCFVSRSIYKANVY